MDNTLKSWFIASVIFIIITGVLFHFIYDWSGKNKIAGIFGSVNESTWEHLKLLFWPALLFSIVEYFIIGKDYANYAAAKAISFYAGILMIIILFYTYTGITGKDCLWADILIFIVSVIISQYIGYKILSSDLPAATGINTISIIAIGLLALAFTVFTFIPPAIPLFEDPAAKS